MMFTKQNGESIMSHKFYRGVPFEKMLECELEAPWVPELRSQRDTAFFENYPDSEESPRNLSTDIDREYFSDF
jgi:hypothetical protein